MSEAVKKKIFNFLLLRRVFVFVKPYRTFFYISLLLAVVMAVFAPIRPYLIQITIDKATGKDINIPQWLQYVLFSISLKSSKKSQRLILRGKRKLKQG